MSAMTAEQVILARFKERCHIAGSVQPGYGMRAQAIRYVQPEHPGVDLDAGLEAMVEKGWLKRNPQRDLVLPDRGGGGAGEGAAAYLLISNPAGRSAFSTQARSAVDQERQGGRGDRSREDQVRVGELQAGHDRLAEAAGADEGREGRGADRDHRRGADSRPG